MPENAPRPVGGHRFSEAADMIGLRVTKFDPALRDARGAYQRDDWVCMSEIGREFNGRVLTREEYERVETAYIESAFAILASSGDHALTIVYLEDDREPQQGMVPLREGMVVTGEDLKEIMRLNLRKEIFCKLEAPLRYLHFGYDYYMYVGIPRLDEDAKRFAKSRGLYLEEMLSPYLVEDR